MTNRSKDFVREPRLEPSRSRRLKAMKANTKGMHAMHAARRTCEVNPSPSSFTEVVKPFSDHLLWLPVYNIETSILSMVWQNNFFAIVLLEDRSNLWHPEMHSSV